MKYTCHTGGAKGADIAWESMGKKYGVKSIAYSFDGHRCWSPGRFILSDNELMDGWSRALVCSGKMKRYIEKVPTYVRQLISRDWFQVKNSDAIFAIGFIVKPGEMGRKYKNNSNIDVVDGGTGYAVCMAIEFRNIPIYVFDQDKEKWFKWVDGKFEEIDYIPKLTENFTGIGTRDTNKKGLEAIESVYINTFENGNP
jgi:hypothetical protein